MIPVFIDELENTVNVTARADGSTHFFGEVVDAVHELKLRQVLTVVGVELEEYPVHYFGAQLIVLHRYRTH